MFKLQKITINKRRPELFALSDRNSQQSFRVLQRRPGDKSLFVQRKGPNGGAMEEGRLRREVPSHSGLFRSIKSAV